LIKVSFSVLKKYYQSLIDIVSTIIAHFNRSKSVAIWMEAYPERFREIKKVSDFQLKNN